MVARCVSATPGADKRAVDVDLVIVGYGAAGAAAAITASRLGASVALLEKQPVDQHYSNTRLSGGLVMSVNDPEGAITYLHECAGGMIPLEVTRAWAERAACLTQWLDSVGIATVRFAGAWFPEFDGYNAIDVLAPLPPGVSSDGVEIEHPTAGTLNLNAPGAPRIGSGDTMHQQLRDAVEAASGVTVYFGHAARRLLRDPQSGRIVGVECIADGATQTFHASQGVVLACGGYEADPELVLNYLKAYPIYFYGTSHNTGDGVRMAQAVGADLWHMNQMIGRSVAHFSLNGSELTFAIGLNPPGYVITDRHGSRFANEWLQAVSKPNFYFELLKYDAERLEYPRIPSFWFFDRRRLESRPVSRGRPGEYEWSDDNRTEIELGWIKTGETIEAAAAAAGITDPDAAARSVAEYNAACASGRDRFGRPADSLVPLDTKPFCCVPVYPGGANTNGGPRRDQCARIVSPDKQPIGGLFGAGELGGPIGLLYPSPGANLSEGIVFGQLAAETALAGR